MNVLSTTELIGSLGGGVFEVKSTSGDTFLGGEDFNNVIANYVTKYVKVTFAACSTLFCLLFIPVPPADQF